MKLIDGATGDDYLESVNYIYSRAYYIGAASVGSGPREVSATLQRLVVWVVLVIVTLFHDNRYYEICNANQNRKGNVKLVRQTVEKMGVRELCQGRGEQEYDKKWELETTDANLYTQQARAASAACSPSCRC